MASDGRVEALCGLSGAGKTQAALDRYTTQVQERGEDTALLILPTARVVRQVRESLVAPGRLPGLLDPRITTFPQLAQLILSANHECATQIGAGARRLLLREAIEGLLGRGESTALGDVGRLPGFATALGELIADLKRAAVQPEQFAAALRRAGLDEALHRELAALYAAYQDALVSRGYYDPEGLFWLARNVLRDGRRRPLERVELLLVDGFTDFTTTQLDMLAMLAAGIPHTVITLDHSPEDAREGLAPWFRDTLQRLARSLGSLRIEILAPGPPVGPLAHLRGRLFAPGTVPRVSAEARVHVLSCPNRPRETREALARAKTLLLTGQAGPGDIALVARDLPERAEELEQLARRLGVPVCIEAPRSPADAPAVRAVLHAYDVVVRGYRREDVLGLLRTTCWIFTALDARGLTAEDVAWAAEKALVVEGRRQWAERVSRLAERLGHSRRDEDRALAAAAEAVAAALREVFALLPDPRGRDLGVRVAELRALLDQTDLRQNVARGDLAEPASVNLRALERLDQALDELEHAPTGASAETGVSPATFQRLLRELLADLAEAPPPAGERIAVLSPEQARQARFAYVFVLGLSEGDFPRRPRDEPFFSATELTQLERAGVVLERRRGPEAREPLLFYGAVAAAERELWLLRPAADLDGRPLQASHYLREVRRLFEPGTLDEAEIPFSEPVPRAEDVLDIDELAVRALFDLAAPPADASVVAHNALVRASPERVPRLLDAIALQELRDARAPSGPYVGEFLDPMTVADLAQAQGPGHRFSPTDLDAFAACPFSYLCEVVLELSEPEYASPSIEPRVAGQVRHGILAAFAARRIEQRPGEPLVPPGNEAASLAELDALITRAFAAAVRRGEVADEALWELERERCRRDLAAWVSAESQQFAAESPTGCELWFGREGDPPVALPQRPDILLTGRIDRVNRAAEGYSLIDYKTGALPKGKAVADGRESQFPIYSVGAEATVPGLTGAHCVGWHYCGLRRPVSRVSFEKPAEIAELRAAAEQCLAATVDAIRAGRFGYAEVRQCVRHCAGGRVCRHQWRRGAPEGESTEDDHTA